MAGDAIVGIGGLSQGNRLQTRLLLVATEAGSAVFCQTFRGRTVFMGLMAGNTSECAGFLIATTLV